MLGSGTSERKGCGSGFGVYGGLGAGALVSMQGPGLLGSYCKLEMGSGPSDTPYIVLDDGLSANSFFRAANRFPNKKPNNRVSARVLLGFCGILIPGSLFQNHQSQCQNCF